MKSPLKLIIIFISLLVLMPFTTGCGKKTEKKDLLKVVKSRGKIVAGVKYDAKPFGFIDEGQQVQGFDIDLCREIAKRVFGDEKAIEFKQVTSSNRIFSITSKTVDFAAATMTITSQRSRIIDFSNPYYIAGQAIMVSKDSPIKTLNDLTGKTIIVVLGSTSEMNIKHAFPKAKVLGFRTYTDAFSALRNGRGDAMTTDDTILYGFVYQNPDFTILKERLTQEPYGLGFKKGVEIESFRELVNSALQEIANDGTLASLEDKWLGDLRTGEGN